MPGQMLTHFTAAAPLAVGGLLVLLSPIYDKFIEAGAEREFGAGRYLDQDEDDSPSGDGSTRSTGSKPLQTHTPVLLITQYTSWALDVAQAGTLILGPLVGVVAAVNGETTNSHLGWIYFGFVVVGFIIFGSTANVKRPAVYGKKRHGYSRGSELVFGWTNVSITAIVLYLGASLIVAFIA
jgi:hypothetical protein